jgi:aromatic-L-amino-acid decarboxylase
MGVVCFRFVCGDESKIDQLNSDIVEKINASGRAYLTQTKLRDRTVMRIGLGNVLTTEEHLRKAWQIIAEVVDDL